MDLETYITHNVANDIVDFSLRCHVTDTGIVSCYIHPQGQDGVTVNFRVVQNRLEPLVQE